MTDEENESLATIFKALGHPTRLKIVRGLYDCCCNVTHIVDNLGIPQTTVSQHLGVLRAAGIVRGEKRGLEICYRVVNNKVEKFLAILRETN